jgi:hypothetical protein
MTCTALQLPGIGKDFQGIVDLVDMQAYRVEGKATTVFITVLKISDRIQLAMLMRMVLCDMYSVNRFCYMIVAKVTRLLVMA